MYAADCDGYAVVIDFARWTHRIRLMTTVLIAIAFLFGSNAACVRDSNASTRNALGGDVMGDPSVDPPSRPTDLRVRLVFESGEAVMILRDNPTSRDFVAALPLNATLSDYSATEKIAYLPRKLSTDGAPAGMDPSAGDVTYYAPWGNLAIFYEDSGYAGGLVRMGRVESGLEALAALERDVTVTVEKLEVGDR